MIDSSATPGTAEWSAPQCPFTIEYSLRALDDIRLAVSDAFFSLPRGGAEIGGVLLGNWESGKLTISDYAPLDCEHAFGPSFNLSTRDEGQLEQLLAASYKDAKPVGWYHSHTRSEIFLSDADQEIHRRFFPEPWQVALVMKPHTFHPTRCGFFFRETQGGIHGEATYQEFTLKPLPMKLAPVDAPPAAATNTRTEPTPISPPSFSAAKQLELTAESLPDEAALENEEEEAEDEPELAAPSFMGLAEAKPRSKLWPRVLLGLAACGAALWAGYFTREGWWPRVEAMMSKDAPLPPQLGLNLIDQEGQLQIRWNTQSPAVLAATGGILRITGSGPFPDEHPLDRDHLLNGYFTITRQSERVDVALVIPQKSGPPAAAITEFVGKMPEHKPVFMEDPAVKKERDALSKQVDQMRNDLKNEAQQNQKLQKSVEQLKTQLKQQTQKRLANQDK